MPVDKHAGVIGGTQLDTFEVTLLATEGIVDFGMAHQAVRHSRQVCLTGRIDLLQTAMARLAGIGASEALTDAVGLAQVGAAVQSVGQHGSNIPEFQMELVVEAVASLGGWSFGQRGGVHGSHRAAFVADVALSLRW